MPSHSKATIVNQCQSRFKSVLHSFEVDDTLFDVTSHFDNHIIILILCYILLWCSPRPENNVTTLPSVWFLDGVQMRPGCAVSSSEVSKHVRICRPHVEANRPGIQMDPFLPPQPQDLWFHGANAVALGFWRKRCGAYPPLCIHGLQAAKYGRYVFEIVWIFETLWNTKMVYREWLSLSCVSMFNFLCMLSDCPVLPATCLAACRKGIVAEGPGCCLLSSSNVNCRRQCKSLSQRQAIDVQRKCFTMTHKSIVGRTQALCLDGIFCSTWRPKVSTTAETRLRRQRCEGKPISTF